MLPNFIGVGVEKAGTTSLFDNLREHPEIGVPSKKEVHFFNANWGNGLLWYEQHFNAVPAGRKVVGEYTPAYFRNEKVPERIASLLGRGVKILFMLRQPCYRAYSHYLHNVATHANFKPFRIEVLLRNAAYAPAVRAFFETFGRDNCKVILFEDYRVDAARVANEVYGFLGVSPHNPAPAHDNRTWFPRIVYSDAKRPAALRLEKTVKEVPPGSVIFYTGSLRTTRIIVNPSPELRRQLDELQQTCTMSVPAERMAEYFATHCEQDVAALEELLRRDLAVWRTGFRDARAEIAPVPDLTPA